MSAQKLKPKDVCRLALDSRLSNREVARLASGSPTTVGKYRNLLRIHEIDRKKLDQMSDDAVEDLVQAKYRGAARFFVEPNWEKVNEEYDKPDVTISLLYLEYREKHIGQPTGALLSETSFGRRLRKFRRALGLSMRQEHIPGQASFVDFSGKHLHLTDPGTGEKKSVEIFVSVLGASQLIFVTAVASQKKADWIEANTRALEYYRGAPATIVPDNLKAAVTNPRRKHCEAVLNRSYLDFAEHYGVVILPTRRMRPKDKALVEISVRMANVWVIAALRNRIFHDLAEMNSAILEIVERINNKRSRRLGWSRRERFGEIEAGCLTPLPAERHAFTEWRDEVRVPRDYHVLHDGSYYSVPFHLVGRTVSLCVSRSTIRIFSGQASQPVAIHPIHAVRGSTVTNRAHMPESHRAYAASNTEEMLIWAEDLHHEVHRLFIAILENGRIPAPSALRQMSRAQLFAKKFSPERLISACRHANMVGAQTVESVHNILRLEIDLRPTENILRFAARPVPHDNIRGPNAYSGEA